MFFAAEISGHITTYFGGKYNYMENKKLQAALEKWQEIQPLSEGDRNRLSRRFTTEKDENPWWYDGESIIFRSSNYGKLLRLMMSEPALTLENRQKHLGINMSAFKKLVNQLLDKKYVLNHHSPHT